MSISLTSKSLCKLFLEISHEELSIDLHRQSLCQEYGFHPLKAFLRIKDIRYQKYTEYGRGHKLFYDFPNIYNQSEDEGFKEFIDAHDLHCFLHKNYHDDVRIEECQILINYFDSNSKGKLYFDDFLLILLPSNDKELRNVMKRTKYSIGEIGPDDRIMPQDCEILLASLFKREIDMSRIASNILQDINHSYTPLELFNLVDITNQGFLDHFSLKNFLLCNEHMATKEELIAIIRRIDTNGDSKVDYDDFVQFLSTDNFSGQIENYPYQLENNYQSRFYHSHTPELSIETPHPISYVNPQTINIKEEPELDEKGSGHEYKSVRFAPNQSQLNIHDLSYSQTDEDSAEYSSFLQKSKDLKEERKMKYAYKKKSKKIKRIHEESLSRSKDSNLPYKYYPEIKSPLRRQPDIILKRLKKLKGSRRRKGLRGSRNQDSRSYNTIYSTSRGSVKRNRSRSKSTRRRLTYED
ncbi:unnamed protein product [Moneuplotes crassus]|uniref:EF-hand domain-containing protein n=1 Tax=Euplotes crassus TaxID=5936 RepID=A0AAD1UK32_EUPCR|nr:unnamed protein product [Moneuplotes crassus]